MTKLTYLLRKRFLPLILLAFFLNAHPGYAQPVQGSRISAQIVDSSTSSPLASSTIQVFRLADKKEIRGLVADSSGKFSVELGSGTYFLTIKHLGYNAYTTKNIELNQEQSV